MTPELAPTGPSLIGFDTETHLIGVGAIIPRLVCATFDHGPWGLISPTGNPADTWDAWCIPNADPLLVDQLVAMFKQGKERQSRIIIQEASFDLSVLIRYASEVAEGTQPGNASSAEELNGLIWEVLDQSMDDELAGGSPIIHDTILREKLKNLSTIGSIDQHYGRDIRYGLADLVYQYHGIDRRGLKVRLGPDGRTYDHNNVDITGTAAAGAAWRLRYKELDGVPLAQWPPEAIQYAIDDASDARRVFVSQELIRTPRGYGSMNSESLQVAAALGLKLTSAVGFPVDQQQVGRVKGKIAEVMSRVELNLQMNGVVRPDGSVNKKVIQERIVAAWAKIGQHPLMTAGGEKSAPQVSSADDVLVALAGVDPIIDMYKERQNLSKIATSFLPSLSGGHIWSSYDTLKETGRVSAKGSSDQGGKVPLFPAMNIQQIPKDHGVRECFLPAGAAPPTQAGACPPPPMVMVSCDYNSMELCSTAQVTFTLFGWSVHRDKINAGYDLHSYLGSAIAMNINPSLVGNVTLHEEAYKELRRLAKLKIVAEDPEVERLTSMRDLAKMYRNFAKPTGLGYPGGLGPDTMATMAKDVYGLDITGEQSRLFRDLWHGTYPEMRLYFNWVNQQTDMQRPEAGLYVYETQGFNRFRAGCSYCACANGKAMQSLGADGAKRAAFWAAKAMLGGVGKGSPFWLLKGCLPQAFIHDEILASLPDDDLLTIRALLLSILMVQAMQVSMPDVLITVEPAAMRRWTKKAEPEWVDDPGLGQRAEAAICRLYGGVPPQEWIDELFQILGPTFNPNRRLVPWDDVNKLKL